jgi:hypothetical protein
MLSVAYRGSLDRVAEGDEDEGGVVAVRSILFGLGTAAVLLASECIMVPEERFGTVEVLATALDGSAIRNVGFELVPAAGGPAIQTSAGIARVRYGDYQLRVHARGFFTASQAVRLNQPEMQVRVNLRLGDLGCPLAPRDIGGRILREDTRELWVKAVPVRGTGGGEARVSKSGLFVISGLDLGRYLVLVLDGEKVVHEQLVLTYPVSSDVSANLAIDLRER